MTRAQSFEYLGAERRELVDRFNALTQEFADLRYVHQYPNPAALAAHRQKLQDLRACLANHTLAVLWMTKPPSANMWRES